MFTLILAAIESFGHSHFQGLYLGTFILDLALISSLSLLKD